MGLKQQQRRSTRLVGKKNPFVQPKKTRQRTTDVKSILETISDGNENVVNSDSNPEPNHQALDEESELEVYSRVAGILSGQLMEHMRTIPRRGAHQVALQCGANLKLDSSHWIVAGSLNAVSKTADALRELVLSSLREKKMEPSETLDTDAGMTSITVKEETCESHRIRQQKSPARRRINNSETIPKKRKRVSTEEQSSVCDLRLENKVSCLDSEDDIRIIRKLNVDNEEKVSLVISSPRAASSITLIEHDNSSPPPDINTVDKLDPVEEEAEEVNGVSEDIVDDTAQNTNHTNIKEETEEVAETHLSKTVKRGRARDRPVRYQCSGENSTVCDICGYVSATVLGLMSHKRRYHSQIRHECDICFKTSGYKTEILSHRRYHFQGDGTLTESAIVMHKLALKRKGITENLRGNLLECVQEYEKKLNDRYNDNRLEYLSSGLADDVDEEAGQMDDSPVDKVHDEQDNKLAENQSGTLPELGPSVTDAPLAGQSSIDPVANGAKITDDQDVSENGSDMMVIDDEQVIEDLNVTRDMTARSVSLSCGKTCKNDREFIKEESWWTGQTDDDTSVTSNALAADEAVSGRCKYECDLCGVRVSSKMSLLKHLKEVHKPDHLKKKTTSLKTQLGRAANPDNTYICPHCDFVCYRSQNFTRHLKTHEKPQTYKCDLCPYTHSRRGEVLRHTRNAHGDKKFSCDKCDTKTRTEVLLRMHKKQVHGAKRTVVCEVCGKALCNNQTYRQHLMKFHGKEEDRAGTVMCPKCCRSFRSQKEFRRHFNRVHGDANEEEEAIAETLRALENGTFECRLCSYSNRQARQVRRHIIHMHVEKKFKCSHCPSAFSRYHFLQKHINVDHLGTETVKCEQCSQMFKTQSALNVHMKRVHTDRDYQCDVCQKSFCGKRSLESHQELHKPIEERNWPFQCSICSSKFRFQSNYKYHMQGHSGATDFICKICSKGLRTKTLLLHHMTKHSDNKPFTCEICIKKFKMKKYLDVHMLSHSAERFACHACCRVFVTKETLNKHICRGVRPPHSTETKTSAIQTIVDGFCMVGDQIDEVNSRPNMQDNISPETYSSATKTTYQNIVVENDSTLPRAHVQQIVLPAVGAQTKLAIDSSTLQLTPVIDQNRVVLQKSTDLQLLSVAAPARTDADSLPVDVTGGCSTAQSEIYMCGACCKVFETQIDIDRHLEEHVKGNNDTNNIPSTSGLYIGNQSNQ